MCVRVLFVFRPWQGIYDPVSAKDGLFFFLLCLVSLVRVAVATHCAKKLGEGCREVWALGADGLYVKFPSDFHYHVVKNSSYAIIEVEIY